MAAYFKLGMGNVDHFVVQTEDMRGRLARRWGIPHDKISVIPSCVGTEVHEAAGRPSQTPDGSLLCITSRAPHKGHTVLPDTLSRLPRSISLSITLNRGDVPPFDRRVEELGLQGRIRYLGGLDRRELIEHLRRAQVVLIPAELESFGLPYYEALALGVPVVAADKGFAREACGNAGRYANTPAEFAVAIESFYGSASARAEAGDRSRERFAAVNVDRDEIAARYLHILEAF